MKKSSVFSPSRIFRTVREWLRYIREDKITLYAAQASFFTSIAAIPFMMMLLILARIIFPNVIESVFTEIGNLVPQRFSGLFDTIYNEISKKASASVISISAATAFWSSSRGVAAVTRGIAGVYGTREHSTFFSELFRSFFNTVSFIVSIIGALTVLVFGAVIREFSVSNFPTTEPIFDLIFRLRSLGFFIILTLFFSLVYLAIARNERKQEERCVRSRVPAKIKAQLPGAALAAGGWMIFSYFFSLYIEFFPTASYIYGSLGTIVLSMLWIYFCMIILLVGAESNKFLHLYRK